ncbi:MAG: undecaprenyl-diphosphate phosphatase [Candidatus Cloacimonetes bacterium]|nr:undecaprenyl-diphosphate phosphatase [Candidatus Cloacimonadota bacterium]
MHILKSLVLGIIQGLTEFLPISSSGHLVLSEHFLKVQTSDTSFEVFLHLGSLLAVIIFFRKDIVGLITSILPIKNPKYPEDQINNRKIVFYMIVSTIVTGVIGFLFRDFFEKLFQNPILVAIMLSITGLIIYLSDTIRLERVHSADMGVWRAFIIGLGQSFAILPGISRSGTTISVSLFTGVKRSEAARYSFLLSIPAILGAAVLNLDAFRALDKSMLISYAIGGMGAFVSGYLVIAALLKIIRNRKLKYFAFYCWIVSITSIILLLAGY